MAQIYCAVLFLKYIKMKRKVQIYTNPYYYRRNADGDEASTGGSTASGGGFWGNFSNITDSLGSLFKNVASGTSSIIGAQRTTTTNVNDNTKTDSNVYIFVGIGLLLLVMIVVFAFAFNKR